MKQVDQGRMAVALAGSTGEGGVSMWLRQASHYPTIARVWWLGNTVPLQEVRDLTPIICHHGFPDSRRLLWHACRDVLGKESL